MPAISEFFGGWGLAVLGGALVLVAFLVNRFEPRRRRRIRQALILYLLALLAAGASAALARVPGLAAWAGHVQIAADLFGAFTLVSLAVLLVFDVALPAVGFQGGAIAGDIAVGVAYVLAAFGVLRAAGLTASSVVTTSAIFSGVLALGMQTTLGNIVGGVALQIDGSVHLGDWLQLPDGTQGKVTAIRWRHTVLETRNWDTVIVPNANLLAQNIVILGKRAGQPVQHRMWVYFNVDFRFPPGRVTEVVREALVADPIPGVALEPAPSVICYDFAKDGRDTFAYYAARYWLTDLPNDDPTSSRVRARIFAALRRAGIPLARQSRTVFFRPDDDAARERRHHERELEALSSIELFHPLTPAELETVASHLRYAPFTAGETCTHQGALAHWLYVLVSGKVEIRRHSEDGTATRALAVIEAPSFFGEMGLIAGEPRTADVVALGEVECYRLDKSGLQQILERRPEIAEQFSKTLARRRVELLAAAEDLDEDAQQARRATEESRILERIQGFFGLERTSRR